MRLGHLVVVIPGILGSTLQTPAGQPVWGQDRRTLAASLWRPGRLAVAESGELVATDVVRSMRVVAGLPWVVPGYDGLLDAITAAFDGVRVEVARPGAHRSGSADVVVFPYDFRLGVQHAAQRLAAEIAARVDGGESGRRRVIVVAHSLGGLVARYWVGVLGGARVCRAIITLGTPHRGAPRALDWLVNGVRVGGVRLDELSELVGGWRSAYDLLPRYRAVWDHDGGQAIYPHDLAAVVGAGFAEAAKLSYGMHLAIEESWAMLAGRGAAPDVLAVFARGHATLAAAQLVRGGLRVSKQDASWLPNSRWRGDGRVPAISAIPLDVDEERRSWLAVPQRHALMPSSPMVVEVLKNFAAASMMSVRGDAPDRPWLGLDLDEASLAGQAVEVGARLYGVAEGVAADPGIAAWVSIHDGDSGRRVARHEMARDASGGWSVSADPLPPGGYRVLVEVVNVPGVDRVTCQDMLVAVPL